MVMSMSPKTSQNMKNTTKALYQNQSKQSQPQPTSPHLEKKTGRKNSPGR